MAQIINTNIASLNAQRNLNSAQNGNDTALQRLSSGLRINSAADDAAGLSISTRFDSQINGNNQAIRNSADGVSLAQTAEGALDSITDSLQRIRELAVQSANGTNNAIDREALNLEAQQLIDEIENVSQTANFNGTSLLDGSFKGITFQTGANVGNSIDVSIGAVTTSTLGVSETAGVSAMGGEITADDIEAPSTTTLTNYVDAQANALSNGDLVINGVSIDASKAAADTSSTAFASSSAIAKAAAINEKSDETGVTAVALETVVQGQALSAATGYADDSGTLEINGVSVALSTAANLDADTNREAIASAINAVSGQTGVTAINTGDDDTGITLVAEDGRNIAISSFTMAAATSTSDLGLGTSLNTASASAVETVVTGSILLQSADGSDITIEGGTGDLANTGFTEGVKSGSAAQLSSTAITGSMSTSVNAIDAGDLTINGISIRATTASDDTSSYDIGGATAEGYTAASAIARAAAINEVAEQTGVSAVAEENIVAGTQGTTVGAASATFTINGVTTSALDLTQTDASDRRSDTVDAINALSGQTGVIAIDAGDGIELRAEDGRNIVISSNQANGATNAFDATGVALPSDVAANAGVNGTSYTFTSTVRLESAGEFTLGSETGGIEDTGFRAGTFGAEEAGTFLKDVDLSTVDGALSAITAVDNALQQVSSERANLGATQNRFNSTINNLTITSENLSASNSRIRDADYAAETAELSRTQVLIQAGISVLAQANARPQQVLSLLG